MTAIAPNASAVADRGTFAAFRALLAKDLRLAGDALLPLAVLIGGFVIVGAAITSLPQSILPDAIRRFGAADFLVTVAFALALLSPILAGWCTAAVVLGDRQHRARGLVSTLPGAPRSRRLARFVALMPAILGPTLLYELLFVAARLLDPSIELKGASPIPWPMLLGLSLVGTVAVWCAARGGRSERSLFAVQLIGHLAAVAIVVACYAIAWVTIPMTLPELGEIVEWVGFEQASAFGPFIRDELTQEAALVAAGLFGFLALAVRWLGDAYRWSRSRERLAILIAASAACVVSVLVPIVRVERVATAAGVPWVDRAAIAFTNEEIAEAIPAVMASFASDDPSSVPTLTSQRWNEGLRRVHAVGRQNRGDHPLLAEFIKHESFATPRLASISTAWYPRLDPRRELATLRAIAAFPELATNGFEHRLLEFAWPHGAAGWAYDQLRAHEAPPGGILRSDADRVAGLIDFQRMLILLNPDMTADERALRQRVIDRLLEAWPDLVMPENLERRYQAALRGEWRPKGARVIDTQPPR